MTTMDWDAVQPHLQAVIAGLHPGEPLIILKDGRAVATLTRSPAGDRPSRAGSASTGGYWMAEDFDAPLEEFREFME